MLYLFDPRADIEITYGTSLPHWYQQESTYFVTFRTADSIPQSELREWIADRDAWLEKNGISRSKGGWKEDVLKISRDKVKEYHRLFSDQFFNLLDKGLGECVLCHERCSNIVVESLFYFDKVRLDCQIFAFLGRNSQQLRSISCLVGRVDFGKRIPLIT